MLEAIKNPPIGYTVHTMNIRSMQFWQNVMDPPTLAWAWEERVTSLHSSPSSTDHIGASICLEYNKL